ncbi:MAG: T9SS type A sorting domain-containing protein [Saprospiraceae bacterium]|nr:T9SS type A sorting domain-containing protein [Saprospiraceae bacterium]
MKNHLLFLAALFLSLFFSNPGFGQFEWSASAQLDVNNVNAEVRIGDLWFNDNEGRYVVPKDDPNQITSIFAGGLWMGGIDQGGNLKVSASTYGGAVAPSFWAGPLNPATGITDPATVQNWDLMFEITSLELAYHLQDYNDNENIDGPVPSNILGWPGRGNPEFFDVHGFNLPNQDLAPFWDRDGDGNYEPMQGDFPLMKGEKAIWWVFNDAADVNPIGATSIQIEVQAMAFAYSSSEDYLNNTTFYDFKLINRATESIDSFATALWIDPDLGCFQDDYIGCSPDDQMAYVYNSDDFDEDCLVPGYGENIPVLGIRVLKGLEDEFGNGPGMSSFMYYVNAGFPSSDPGQTDPNIGPEVYNYLNATWRDGTPLSQGGTGYDPGNNLPPYNYAYDGSPLIDSLNINWTECDLGDEPGDRRMVITSGTVNMNPGDARYLSYAVMWSQNVNYPCPDLTSFFQESQQVQDFYDTIGDGLYSDTEEQLAELTFVEVYPNPATDHISIKLLDPDKRINRVEIFNAAGQQILIEAGLHREQIEISTANLVSGAYYYRLITDKGFVRSGKLIIQ